MFFGNIKNLFKYYDLNFVIIYFKFHRLVHHKKYIEVEQIQRLAMLADKEAKQITYKLLEENFLQMQELRKPTTNANSSGPNKSFFLFYVDINLVRIYNYKYINCVV